ncbi:TPA: hypothetical protein HA361_01545 [Candidatus Woesearchaeota archaeon]|nr:hypothetical protein [Candidatus Woesearchaeota archaeon]HII68879.1 hypothetical protein [Candidatus Woesearchaeota archaeon]
MKAMAIFVLLLTPLLALCVFPAATAAEAFHLELAHIDGRLLFSGVSAQEAAAFHEPAAAGALVRVIGFDGAILYDGFFALPPYGPFTIDIPYFKKAKAILLKFGEQVLEVNVAHLADTCGNLLCEQQESRMDCPADCVQSGRDDVCEMLADDACDLDCKIGGDPDCSKASYAPAAKTGEDGGNRKEAPMATPDTAEKTSPESQRIPLLIIACIAAGCLIILAVLLLRRNQK